MTSGEIALVELLEEGLRLGWGYHCCEGLLPSAHSLAYGHHHA